MIVIRELLLLNIILLYLMKGGLKTVGLRLLITLLNNIYNTTITIFPLVIVEHAFYKLIYPFKLVKRKLGSLIYYIPTNINYKAALIQTFHILIKQLLFLKVPYLTTLFIDTVNNKGTLVSKQTITIKQILLNRIFLFLTYKSSYNNVYLFYNKYKSFKSLTYYNLNKRIE